jgi:hypothetical protein
VENGAGLNLTGIMKNIFFFASLCFLPLAGFCQAETKVLLYNNKIEVSLPAELEKEGNLPDENIYHYANKERNARFSISLSAEEVSDNDIPGYTDLAITSVKKESASAKIYDDGISLNEGKNIGYIKYTDAVEKDEFNYVFYGSLNEQLVTFYFVCKTEDRSKWEKKIEAIVASLKIKDKIIQ